MKSLCSLLVCLSLLFCPMLASDARAFFFGGVSLKDEKEMGRKFDSMIRSRMPMVDDPEVAAYVRDIVDRLVRAMPKQPFEFKSSVVLHNSLNAFAVPGGFVYVLTGLIMNMDREEELAGVLAHELAHVTQRHVASRMERAQYLTIGALLAAVAGVAIGGPAGAAAAVTAAGAGQSAMLNYSRLDESEADNIGLQYLAAAGYPVDGMVGGFKVLRKKSWLAGVSVPTYLSTHPAIGDRVNSLSARIASMPANARGKKNDNSRFRRVNTLLWARYGDEQAALRRFADKDALSHMGRGIVLSRQNRVNDAAAAFDSALKAAPEDPLVLREAGIFHFRKGDLPRAAPLLQKAMRKDGRDYMASFFYGRLLDEHGRHKEAAGHYREVLRHVPEAADVHEALARSLGHAGDNLQAYVHMAYGAIYANNKKLAERYFKQAKNIADKSGNSKAFKRLETVYKERKEMWEKS